MYMHIAKPPWCPCCPCLQGQLFMASHKYKGGFLSKVKATLDTSHKKTFKVRSPCINRHHRAPWSYHAWRECTDTNVRKLYLPPFGSIGRHDGSRQHRVLCAEPKALATAAWLTPVCACCVACAGQEAPEELVAALRALDSSLDVGQQDQNAAGSQALCSVGSQALTNQDSQAISESGAQLHPGIAPLQMPHMGSLSMGHGVGCYQGEGGAAVGGEEHGGLTETSSVKTFDAISGALLICPAELMLRELIGIGASKVRQGHDTQVCPALFACTWVRAHHLLPAPAQLLTVTYTTSIQPLALGMFAAL